MNCETALATSLRSLRHPVTLFSVVLLLLNDHVLKIVAPSALTGKLSDFAGLFFFPILLATMFGLALDRCRVRPRLVAGLAFVVTLAWFVLVKTSPAVNAATTAVLEALLGTPVRIVRDPADLLALLVLLPAWQLWRQVERAHPAVSPDKRAYLALGLAALATMATSCPPDEYVSRLAASQEVLYTGITYGGSEITKVAMSTDGARTWEEIQSSRIPSQVFEALQQEVEPMKVVCLPSELSPCYRLTGLGNLEGTTDGSQTWRVVWELPAGRLEYMERAAHRPLCGKTIDYGPHDLLMMNKGDSYILVVAMGNEGVLVRTAQGEWQRVAIGEATPTPYKGFDLLVILGETGFSILAAILILATFSVWIWVRVLLAAVGSSASEYSWFWAVRPILVSAVLSVVIVVFDPWSMSGFALAFPLVAFFLLALGMILTWGRVVKLARSSEHAGKAGWETLKTSVGVFLVSWSPFLLWTLAWIPYYAMAMALSLALGLAALIWGALKVNAAGRRAVGDLSAQSGIGDDAPAV